LNYPHVLSQVNLLSFALFVNLPLGYLRQGCRKYSLRWFVFIHLSIPFIVAWRLTAEISWHIIPFTLSCAVLGQVIGGRIYRRSRK